jgi:glycosyltransferase involved in cell wall biosynthesis
VRPELSVVIPTYNRADALARTLSALAADAAEAPPFEVVVVDDGSTDATAQLLSQRAASSPFSLRGLHQENQKPAAARNRGTREARAPVVLYLGDDTIPSPGLLAAHARHHRSAGRPCAVVGYTPYHPASGPERLLFFLQEMGHQFGYGLIEDAEELAFNFVYSSNLSAPASVLGPAPFSEAIRAPAWEDVELGFRLKKRGVRVLFEPEAVAYHLHPTTLLRFCERQEMVGATSLQALERSPELADFFGGGRPSRRILRAEMPLRLAARMLDLLMRLGLPVYAPRLFRAILDLHYHRGLRRACQAELPGRQRRGARAAASDPSGLQPQKEAPAGSERTRT